MIFEFKSIFKCFFLDQNEFLNTKCFSFLIFTFHLKKVAFFLSQLIAEIPSDFVSENIYSYGFFSDRESDEKSKHKFRPTLPLDGG